MLVESVIYLYNYFEQLQWIENSQANLVFHEHCWFFKTFLLIQKGSRTSSALTFTFSYSLEFLQRISGLESTCCIGK